MAKTLSRVLVAVALLCGSSALAQNAKVSIQMADLSQVSALTASPDGYSTVLRGEIQTAQQKDLVVGVSLESGLYTDTTVISKNLQADKSVAMARILVRVVVDDSVLAYPGVVTFAEREQGLVARFAGYFECTDLNGDGIMNFGECDYTKPEELQLWLKTLNANAFFFAMPDLDQGVHKVEVQAKVETSTSSQLGSASANAWIGKGTISIEETRMIKGTDVGFGNSFDLAL